jgi:hypothetical protein
MALIMSHILCLKSLKCFELQENRQTLDYVWWCWNYMVDGIMTLMRSTSHSFNPDTVTALIDAFDTAATNLAQLFRAPRGSHWGPINQHWAHRNKLPMRQVDMLSLTVEEGLLFYVKRNLEHDPSLVLAQTTLPRRDPLLAFVILNRSIINL